MTNKKQLLFLIHRCNRKYIIICVCSKGYETINKQKFLTPKDADTVKYGTVHQARNA